MLKGSEKINHVENKYMYIIINNNNNNNNNNKYC
jgi:hypothetical protein